MGASDVMRQNERRVGEGTVFEETRGRAWMCFAGLHLIGRRQK